MVACFISDGRQATETATATASVTFGTAAQRARSGTELVAERRSAEVTYLQPNATCCKMLQVHGLVFGGFPMDFCHLLLVSKSCDLDVVARCRTSSRWKPATRTLARGWGSQIKDEVDGLLGT